MERTFTNTEPPASDLVAHAHHWAHRWAVPEALVLRFFQAERHARQLEEQITVERLGRVELSRRVDQLETAVADANKKIESLRVLAVTVELLHSARDYFRTRVAQAKAGYSARWPRD